MDRLNKEQWLDHGLQTLAQSGFTALKADTLAKALGVSRGSFYWHFANLAAFHTALLDRWKVLTFDTAVEEIESASTDVKTRLHNVINLAADSALDLELAVRIWANSNERVRQAVNEVDQLRLSYLLQIFTELGLSPDLAYARTRIVYFGFLGQMLIGEEISAEQRTLIVNELINSVYPA